jgi:hypothetical protein
MERKTVLLLFLSLILAKVFSQESGDEKSNIQLDRFNHQEYKTFRDFVQRNAFFPPEAFNRTGVLLAGFTLSPNGEIVNVFALNSLSSTIDNQILDLIESSSGFWRPIQEKEQSNKNSMIIIPFVFCLKNTEYDIKVDNLKIKLMDKIVLTSMMGQEQMSASGYIKTDKLKNSLDELILKGKYEKANEIIGELLRRDPLNTAYYSKFIEVEGKLGHIDNACKNLKFVKAYLIQQPEKVEINCN